MADFDFTTSFDASRIINAIKTVSTGVTTLITAMKQLTVAVEANTKAGGRANVATMKAVLANQKHAKSVREVAKALKEKKAAEKKAEGDRDKARRQLKKDKQTDKQHRELVSNNIRKANTGILKDMGATRPGQVTKRTGANAEEIQGFNKAREALLRYQKANNISGKKILQVWRDVRLGVNKTFVQQSVHLGKARDLAGQLDQAYKKLGRSARNAAAQTLKASLKQQKGIAKVAKATKKAVKSTNDFGISWKAIGRLVAVAALHRSISALTMKLREAGSEAINLQIAISEVRTIDTSKSDFDDWADTLRNLSDAWGLDIVDVAEAAYQSLSNQVVQSTSEMDSFGEAVLRFATATKTTAANAINALSGAINAYAKNIHDAENVAATLFKTIEQGRLRAEDLTGIGNVAILASKLGIELHELGAAYATLTIQGVKQSEAATQLRGIFIKLIKPTKVMKGFLREMGFETGEAALKVLGFEEFMRRLQEVTKGSSAELAKFINRIRGLSGGLAFQGEGFEILKRNVADLKDPLEAYERAVQLTINNTGKQYKIAMNQLRNFFIQDVADPLINRLSDLTDGFKGIVSSVKLITSIAENLLIPVLLAVTAAIVRYTVATVIASKVHPFASFIIVFTAVLGIIDLLTVSMAEHSASVRQMARVNQVALASIRAEAAKTFHEVVSAVKESIKIGSSEVTIFLYTMIEAINKSGKKQQSVFEDLINGITDSTSEALKIVSKLLSDVEKKINDSKSAIESIEKKIRDMGRSKEQKLFDFSLEGLTDNNKIKKIEERLSGLFDTVAKKATEGNTEEVVALETRIRDLHQQRVTLAVKLNKEFGIQFDQEEAFLEMQGHVLKAEKALLLFQQDKQKTNEKEQKILEKNIEIFEKAIKEFKKTDFEDLFQAKEDSTVPESVAQIKKDFEERKKNLLILIGLEKKAKLDSAKLEELAKKEELAFVEALEKFRILALIKKRDEDAAALKLQIVEQEKLRQKAVDQNNAFSDGMIKVINTLHGGIKDGDSAPAFAEAILGKITGETVLSGGKDPTGRIGGVTQGNVLDKIIRSSLAKGIREGFQKDLGVKLAELLPILKTARGQGATDEDVALALNKLVKLSVSFIKPAETAADAQVRQISQEAVEFQQNIRALIEVLKLRVSGGSVNQVIVDIDKTIAAMKERFTREAEEGKKLDDQAKGLGDLQKEASVKLLEAAQALDRSSHALYVAALRLGFEPKPKQAGGFIGTDSVLTQLTPGEFVMNAQSSRRFRSQLMTMNSGLPAQSLQGGGSVTNVGDINVSVTGTGYAQSDIAEIGRGLRREIRRGSLQLGN